MRIQSPPRLLIATSYLFLVYGCAEPTPATKVENTATSEATENSTETIVDSPSATAAPPSETPAATTTQPVVTTPPPSTTTAPPTTLTRPPVTSASELRIRMRGVTLPQSLPTGTAMGFSVEYEIVSGTPSSSATYEWVIESPQSGSWKRQVPLQNRGSLETFVTEWPPDPGTYTTYIQQVGSSGEAKVVSEKLKLTYSCQ